MFKSWMMTSAVVLFAATTLAYRNDGFRTESVETSREERPQVQTQQQIQQQQRARDAEERQFQLPVQNPRVAPQQNSQTQTQTTNQGAVPQVQTQPQVVVPEDAFVSDDDVAPSDATGAGEVEEPEFSDSAVAVAVRPPSRPERQIPGVGAIEDVDPNDPIFLRHLQDPAPSECRVFNMTTHNQAPIWARFVDSFSRCAPGCSPRIISTFGCRSSGTSCHQVNGGGHAVDVTGIDCGEGQDYRPSRDQEFDEFVTCMRSESRSGGDWTVLYKESTRLRSRDCRGASLTNKQTTCHWDHVHLDLGC